MFKSIRRIVPQLFLFNLSSIHFIWFTRGKNPKSWYRANAYPSTRV